MANALNDCKYLVELDAPREPSGAIQIIVLAAIKAPCPFRGDEEIPLEAVVLRRLHAR
jgi:hypothetical protein